MDNRLFMMSGNKANELTEHKFENEDMLQEIIASNPHLLEREYEDGKHRLFLVKRELSVPESDYSSNSYSLDHLFICEDSVPVLVEVKRSSDTRLKREVVAQMFDYACRARSWDAEVLRQTFRDSNTNDPEALSLDNDAFWERVARNLKSEHIRLVFAADEIPDTLRVLIEFLDRSMPDIEVYGVVIQPYRSENASLLTSTIVGNSPIEKEKATPRAAKNWNLENYCDFLRTHKMIDILPIFNGLIDGLVRRGFDLSFGKGAQYPSVHIFLDGQHLFYVESWQYTDQYRTVIEIKMKEYLNCLENDWNAARLQETLFSFSGSKSALDNKLIWITNEYIHIDLRAFDSDSLSDFIEILQNLAKDIHELQCNT